MPNRSAPTFHGSAAKSSSQADDEITTSLNAHNSPCPGMVHRIFFCRQETPGQHSPNIAVRTTAHVWHATKITLLSNYVNFILFMVPLGIIAGHSQWGATAVFTINVLAIPPLAAVFSFVTYQIFIQLNVVYKYLFNATFANAVDLIISIVALKGGQIRIVQTFMLGSILSNLLLVPGMCFFFGGIANINSPGTTAQTPLSQIFLVLASRFFVLYSVLDGTDGAKKDNNLAVSRSTAIVLLFLFAMYMSRYKRNNLEDEIEDGVEPEEKDGKEPREPVMGVITAGLVLVMITVLVAICADYLVDSIDDVVESLHVSKTFIGLILLPIAGKADRSICAATIVVTDENKMELVIDASISWNLQIAFLFTPLLVIFGWAAGEPMSLDLGTFKIVALVFSIPFTRYTVQVGKSKHFEGVMLLGLYFIIAWTFFVTTDGAKDEGLSFLAKQHIRHGWTKH